MLIPFLYITYILCKSYICLVLLNSLLMRREYLKPTIFNRGVNFMCRKTLYTDFIPNGVELCRYICTFMPKRECNLFQIRFIYVFFQPNETFENPAGAYDRFKFDFVFTERWLNSTSLKGLGVEPLSLYRTYTFLSNPTLWQI